MSAGEIPFPEATKGYHPTPCTEPRCGQPQEGAERPRKGWVQIKAAAETALWFCGWHCAGRHAIRRELGGFTWPAGVDDTVARTPQDGQRTRRPLTPELLEDVAELESQGHGLRDVCDRLDLSRTAVRKAQDRQRQAAAS